MKKIRVLFRSIQPSVISALLSFFANDPMVSADADGYENYSKLKKKYDIVVFDDGSLNKMSIEKIIKSLNSAERKKAILYSTHAEKEYFYPFLFHSIDGIVSYKSELSILKDAIFKVARSENYYCNYFKEIVNAADNDVAEDIVYLTRSEKRILELIATGLSNRQISESLYISIKTVESHKQNIRKKFD